MHVQYTARDGGETFKSQVTGGIRSALNSWLDGMAEARTELCRVFSLRQEFSSHLHRFLNPSEEDLTHETQLTVEEKHFQYFLKGRGLTVLQASVIIKPKDQSPSGGHVDFVGIPISLTTPGLPVPDSPVSNTVDSVGATLSASSRISINALLLPIKSPDFSSPSADC